MYNGQKHPHGRGEDGRSFSGRIFSAETPPRTWGRRSPDNSTDENAGNTPTDVGKTRARSAPAPYSQKHPHGRGEDSRRRTRSLPGLETPPRTWGRPPIRAASITASRNTPTDVGKTSSMAIIPVPSGKHPHGRGEDPDRTGVIQCQVETPPRTWGRRCARDTPLTW